jgi:hypothetical protein
MLLCFGQNRRILWMSAARLYCAEEIERNCQALLQTKVPLFLCVEGRHIRISTPQELSIVAKIVAVYHAQIGQGAHAWDEYVDASETMEAAWDAVGNDVNPAEAPLKAAETTEAAPETTEITRTAT